MASLFKEKEKRIASKETRLKFHLPEDVVMTDVLSRLPVKSLLRFKCICRQWRSLISSPYFTSLHLNHSIRNPLSQSILVHLLVERKSIPFDPVTFSPRTNYLTLCFNQVYALGDEMKFVDFVGSINGLLCICGGSDRCVCLCNPSTRMFRKIKTGIIPELTISYSIGFGFDPIANDYKVVVLYPRHLEVWSAKLEYWRIIKFDYNLLRVSKQHICDVIVNEFAYWISGYELASFNMSTEVLRVVPMPRICPEYICYRGFNWKGNFALATFDGSQRQYQAWIIENDTLGKEYWRKTFSFQLDFEPHHRFVCDPINIQNGKVIYRSSADKLIFYDLETRKMKKAKSTKYYYALSRANYYVESLICINGFKPIVENAKKKKRKRMFLY